MQAWTLLRRLNQLDVQGQAEAITASAEERQKLRLALLSVRNAPEPEFGWNPDAPDLMMGLLASDVRLGVRALRDWTQAMQVAFKMPESRVRCQCIFLLTACEATKRIVLISARMRHCSLACLEQAMLSRRPDH